MLKFSNMHIERSLSRSFKTWENFASVDPWTMSASQPHSVKNMLGGVWTETRAHENIVDPLTGSQFMTVPDTDTNEVEPFVKSLSLCPKSGLHNPIKNPERYKLLGDVSAKAASILRQSDVLDYFSKLIERVAPKSKTQSLGETFVTMKFLENFGGDQVRFLARSFAVPGDHYGQTSNGYRWPYGPVVIIAPFNFPLEIPMLQMMGALYMGNKVLLKVDSKVSVVMEQALRLLHSCGLPLDDVDFINCKGNVMHHLLTQYTPAMTQFTGSSRVAELLARDLHGRIKIEDSGFDWKILGPDVSDEDYVAYTSDQDAYAYSGQKCSAQSIIFLHENWENAGFLKKLSDLAARRSLADLTIGPVLTVSNKRFQDHIATLLNIPGSSVLFGGELLSTKTNHSIPDCYGSWLPTALQIPIEQLLKPENFGACTIEIFGPFQIVVPYTTAQLPLVLEACERMSSNLTAAIVSNDAHFQNQVLGHTINGTTYCGIRARTTGAPQNHWFGPAGDPRAAGIGTPEAIKLVWSCHREIIMDEGPVPSTWTIPASS